MAGKILDFVDAIWLLLDEIRRPSNLGIVVATLWIFSLWPLIAAWSAKRRGQISNRTLIAFEIAWLSTGVCGTITAWWFWYVDFRQHAAFTEEAWIGAYVVLVILGTLVAGAIKRWLAAESFTVVPLMRALCVAALLSLGFYGIFYFIGIVVMGFWGLWGAPDEIGRIAAGIAIGLHIVTSIWCARLWRRSARRSATNPPSEE